MSADSLSLALTLLDELIAVLEGLMQAVERSQVDGRSLQQQFLQAQQLYQQSLLPTLADVPAASALTPYQTEMNRALRLLGMDVTFLQAAQKSLTVQQRQAQMQQRLTDLLAFARQLRQQLPTIKLDSTVQPTAMGEQE